MFDSIKNIFISDDLNLNVKEILSQNQENIYRLKKEPDDFQISNMDKLFGVSINYIRELPILDDKDLTALEIAKKLKTTLPKYIYGQNHVIEEIVDYFKNNLIKTNTPKATFLFLGPPATGKTYMAEVMAKLLDGYKYKVFDMTQFVTEDSGIGLYGSDYRYKNSSVGELTNFVLHNPKSIIVFDEIEKAHSAIQNVLLSIYNTGKLKDKNGWIKEYDKYIPFDNSSSNSDDIFTEVDFSQTILIFTSNVGKELYNSKYFWDIVKNDYSQAENMIIQTLQKEIKIENGQKVPAITSPFLSRLSSGGLLLFKKLDFQNLLRIAKNVFNENIKYFKKEYKLEIEEMIDFIYAIFLLSFAPKIDIRRLKSKVAGEFFDLVTDYIIENDLDLEIERKIKIEIEDDVKKYFFEKLKPLLKDDIVKYMFRKNLTLKIDKELEYKNNIFTYTIKNISLQKVKNVKDIGNDGIVFEVPDVSFDDIAGHKKVKDKLKEMVTFMKNPKKIKSLGIDIPKGILFYGPPGTGKTMLAKAVANEASLPFVATTGSDLLNLETIDKIFDIAREYAPSIVFIDEFDAIGSRENKNGREIFINKLLSKIDGFSDEEDIFIIAATNYPQNIDSALLRSGRIDIKVEIKSLDKEARKYFIQTMLNSYKTEGEFNIDKLVLYTTGLNGSDLEKIKRECGVYMIRNSINKLNESILIEMINTIKYGEKIEIDISHTLESTAIHEAGHAVISKILRPDIKIEQITITPRDKALGFVSYSNEDNYKNLSKEDIKKEIQILLAGRFAQFKKYGDKGIDSGASDDLDKATKLIHLAVTTLGMDEEIGHLNISNIDIDFNIKNRIKAWIKEAEENIKTLIDENWDKIENVANKLLEEESIDEDELIGIIKFS